MSLIAITGLIASGKSTAMNMLKSRHYGDMFDFEFIDLDQYSKQLRISNVEIQQKQLQFFSTHFPQHDNIDILLSPTFIIENIFTNEILYNEYGQIFEQYFIDYLTSLNDPNKTYIIECSALFSYPKLAELFDSIIIVEPSKSLHFRNACLRNIPIDHFEIFTSIYNRAIKKLPIKHVLFNIYHVKLVDGTLLELRSKIEQTLIYCVHFSIDVEYLMSCMETLSYFDNVFVPEDFGINPYHNEHHTLSVITDLILSGKHTPTLGLVAIFHDYGYIPNNKDNETNAINSFKKWIEPRPDIKIYDKVRHIISQTTYSDNISDESAIFGLSDMSHFLRTPEEIFEVEQLIFKEYNKYAIGQYKQTRIKLLNNIINIHPNFKKLENGINLACGWLKTFQPRIGMFCGSFNPFTVGHLDIVEKAQQMFDKVIIVQGYNRNKPEPKSCEHLVNKLNVEVISHCESIPRLINSIGYAPILIRGIRNHNDVNDAVEWINQINEFTNYNVNLCMIAGDPSLNHISSSFVRHAESLGSNVSQFVV